MSDIILSASSDWTCQIWDTNEKKVKLVMKSTDLTEEVIDARWAPFCSTLFASIAKGNLEKLFAFQKIWIFFN